jgi:hypothetical protein
MILPQDLLVFECLLVHHLHGETQLRASQCLTKEAYYERTIYTEIRRFRARIFPI